MVEDFIRVQNPSPERWRYCQSPADIGRGSTWHMKRVAGFRYFTDGVETDEFGEPLAGASIK